MAIIPEKKMKQTKKTLAALNEGDVIHLAFALDIARRKLQLAAEHMETTKGGATLAGLYREEAQRYGELFNRLVG